MSIALLIFVVVLGLSIVHATAKHGGAAAREVREAHEALDFMGFTRDEPAGVLRLKRSDEATLVVSAGGEVPYSLSQSVDTWLEHASDSTDERVSDRRHFPSLAALLIDIFDACPETPLPDELRPCQRIVAAAKHKE